MTRMYMWTEALSAPIPSKKQITLVFTAADKADGADAIISTLKKHGIKGGFFFTGEFYELYPDVVKRLLDEGHFAGTPVTDICCTCLGKTVILCWSPAKSLRTI